MDHPFTFDVYQSEADRTWVIHVDTPEHLEGQPGEPGPRLRLYINDGPPVYENPRFGMIPDRGED